MLFEPFHGRKFRAIELGEKKSQKVSWIGKTRLRLLGPGAGKAGNHRLNNDKHEGKKKAYGPYYQWTFKKEGKTITQNLTADQAIAFQEAIENHREMETKIQEMRELSLEILEGSIPGVKKRKKRSD